MSRTNVRDNVICIFIYIFKLYIVVLSYIVCMYINLSIIVWRRHVLTQLSDGIHVFDINIVPSRNIIAWIVCIKVVRFRQAGFVEVHRGGDSDTLRPTKSRSRRSGERGR